MCTEQGPVTAALKDLFIANYSYKNAYNHASNQEFSCALMSIIRQSNVKDHTCFIYEKTDIVGRYYQYVFPAQQYVTKQTSNCFLSAVVDQYCWCVFNRESLIHSILPSLPCGTHLSYWTWTTSSGQWMRWARRYKYICICTYCQLLTFDLDS